MDAGQSNARAQPSLRVALAKHAEVEHAIAVAAAAQAAWAATNPQRRARVLFKFLELVQREQHSLAQLLYVDTRLSLPDDLLMYGDKMSMANSLEARVPLLDRQLVEFVESLPVSLKPRGMTGKYVHKKAAERWLPPETTRRRKKGFATPVYTWFQKSLDGWLRETYRSAGYGGCWDPDPQALHVDLSALRIVHRGPEWQAPPAARPTGTYSVNLCLGMPFENDFGL